MARVVLVMFLLRLSAALLWDLAMSVSLATIIKGAKVWRALKPFKRWKARRQRKDNERLMDSWTQEHGRPLRDDDPVHDRPADEAAGEFFTQEDDRMDNAIVGALKSKLVWLGIVQIGYSLFETWANGGLNAEAVSTAISGVLTIIFRAVTTRSLAEKAQ